MNKTEWFELFNRHKDDLRALVDRYHPGGTKPGPAPINDTRLRADRVTNFNDPMPITAPMAEKACELVRQEIAAKHPGNPALMFDVATEKQDASALVRLLNDAWFGLPESASVRGLPGFFALCDLCEGIDEDADENADCAEF